MQVFTCADISDVWPGGGDVAFALALLAQYNVTVLPGSLLAQCAQAVNLGAGHVRPALVAGMVE